MPRPRSVRIRRAVTSLRFVLVDQAMGELSLPTALFAIPSMFSAGTAVDLGILVADLAMFGYGVRQWTPPK